MTDVNRIIARGWSRLGQRGTVFGVALPELAAEDSEVLVLTADLVLLSGLERFQREFPENLINVGIAEQNLIGISASLANEGYKTYATTYANFIAMRAYEQIRLNCGYMGFPVRVIGSGSGLSMGMSGNTHYGIEDIALMRAIPNMTVVCPADAVEAYWAIHASRSYKGPMYIRLTGVLNMPMVYTENLEYRIGKANLLRKGNDILIVSHGSMVHVSLEVATKLEEQGLSTSVVDMHTIKPLDTETLDTSFSSNPTLVVSVEEHSIIGGLGSAMAEYQAEKASSVPLLRIGMQDTFLHPGEYQYLLEQAGLTVDSIVQRILGELET